MEPMQSGMDDWQGEEPIDDPVFSDIEEQHQMAEVCTRPQVYSNDELYGLLARQITNRIVSVFPAVSVSDAVAMLLQRSFQFDRILEQLSTLPLEKLHRRYFLGKELTTNKRNCLVCEQSQRTEMVTCCNSICSLCLQQYVEGEVQKNQLLIRCPNSECGCVIPYRRMHPAVMRRYEKKLGVAYAKSMKNSFQSCLDCQLYIRVPPMRLQFLQCQQMCGCRICLSCHTFCHRPLCCDEVVKWTARIVSEGLSMQYISKNTKKCPNCKVNIQKNEGCNHMTCRQCKHEFCWICFVDWKTHCSPGYKGCTKFEEKNKASTEQNDKQRFYFYCERYQAFEESEQAAYRLRNGIMAERIHQFETILEHPKDDFDFFRVGINCVIQVPIQTIQGRRAIKYLYAFLCIGKLKQSAQDIIEHNLSTAQHNLEHLHGMIESAIKSEQMHDFETYDKMRFEIRNYSSVTDRFLQNIAEELSK